MDVKQELKKIIELTDKQLAEYWDEELSINFGFNERQKDLVKKLLEHAKEHNLRPAKRLRASFVYFGYLLGKNEPDEKIRQPMEAIELVHTALLMQDDVMDQDDLRRGLPTTHKFFENGDLHFGESMANTLADSVLTMGYERMLRSDFDKDLTIKATLKLLRGITNTAYGQSFDVDLEKINDWVEDDVMALHKAKTAIYSYENPLFIGAILAGLEGKVFEILHDYSMDGGVAFQLQDDILGVFGDSEVTGKSDASDLIQGKRTLLVLKALEMGNEEQKEAIKKIWGNRKAKKEDIELAKKAIIDSKSLDYNKKISRELAEKASNTAEMLRDLKLNPTAIDFIGGIARYMVDREL
jgi:geranylgeranyl diphosphate synthase, type I